MTDVTWWKRCLAEAIGTFGLTLIVVGAICADRYSGGELGLVGVALASGAALTALATTTLPLSGGHLNPALTIAATLRGSIEPRMAAAYVGAQLLGSTLAGVSMARLYAPEVWQPVGLGAPSPSPEVAMSTAAFIEALLTFVWVFVALQVAVNRPAAAIVYGLAIGSVLAAATLIAGPLTGAALNPARAIGPALASGLWRDQAIYWIGPISGGIVAALLCRSLEPARTS